MRSKRDIPLEMAEGIVGGEKGQHYRFTVVADGIIRMEWAPDGVFEDRLSSFAYHRNQVKAPKFETRESADKLEILTSRFHLTYNKQDFSAFGLYALVYGFTRSLWRYKEQGQPNLGGTYRTLDDVDGKFNREHGADIEVGEGILSPKGYALLDDSTSMLFDSDGFVAARRPGEGRIDCYLFAYGHDYRQAIKAFYSISGPPPLLPRWTLGNWWSRYYAYSADLYLELMDRFKSEGVPLSVAVLDMDWHLVNDRRVVDAGQTGWTGYTWNKDLFPDPPKFLRQLHDRNLKVTLNDHPADGIHSYEDIYPKVAKFLGYDASKEEAIPFDAVDRDYLKAYFDIVLKSLEDDGCDFWWIDWQQGPYSRLKDVDPLWVLNHFHFLHNKQVTRDGLPITFSRYGGPGSHRYPVGFSGDTYTTWASLDYQPEFTATASNIGYGWWSHDIGGHMLGVRDDELIIRWVQFGVLSPIMRLHSTQSRWVTKEPWKLLDIPRSIISHFLRLRHRLIPYLQTMNHRAAFESEPLIQPMYWAYPEHDEAYKCKNQYLFGTEMMVAPITTPQDVELRMGKVKAWLPAGKFVDFFTGLAYEGNRDLWVSRPLHQYPVFLKQGAIVPLDASSRPENGGSRPAGIEVVVATGADGSFDLLEEPEGTTSLDDSSAWDRIPIRFVQKTGSIKIGPSSSKTDGKRSWSVRLLGAENPGKIQVSVDGKSHDFKVSTEENGVLITIEETPSRSAVNVEIGAEPALKRPDLLDIIEPVLLHAQNEYDVKDKVWAILSDKTKTLEAQLAGFQALDMSDNLRLFILEYMSAEVCGKVSSK